MQDSTRDDDNNNNDQAECGSDKKSTRVVVKVWASDAADEKPLPLSIWHREDPSGDGALFGTIQARVARAYAAGRPGAAPLRFYPAGAHVATNAARGPVFHAEDKINDVLAQCAVDDGNEIHVLDIHRLAAAHVETAPAQFVPLLPAPPSSSSLSSSSSRRDVPRPHDTPPSASRSQPARTTIRCTADGCWVSAKDIVCDALSLWGVHSALPQNTVRRMKEQHPSMFVKRALSGGGAHAPVIDTDSIDLFCERCAAAVAPAHAGAMRAYPKSDRRARSVAHVLARRSQCAGASSVDARPAPLSLVAPCLAAVSPPTASRSTLAGLSVSGCASPSVSNDSDSLSPEDGWSTDNNDNDDDGDGRTLVSLPAELHRRHGSSSSNVRTSEPACMVNADAGSSQRIRRRRHHQELDTVPNGRVASTDDDRAGEGEQGRRHKRRRISVDPRDQGVRDRSMASKLMARCTTKTEALSVWKWGRDCRWRLAIEMRCVPEGAGSPWEVLYDAEAPHRDGQAHAWIDAVDAENIVCESMASPCALVAVGHRRHLPTIEAFYTDDGGRRDGRSGADSPVDIASVLDGRLASACRRWARAPEDRREGLGLFRRAVAFGALVADGPYALRWERLVKDMENALA
ncbi:hypothetical protein pmac_cds_46 [Pandoravirus macleodensis]|uniref:Uncharacterized protein n=1 Tax=Pandoravirus macleodensis TaxID=2107707 RepID=A0A2U7UE69_9VIRU|nr:hypothetical protein pmac_cds_46 [Pandoravirus macleodensis]AVK76734.1 hypothetical protein pmac_cds_46 [Pandoravirus macleodensis]UMO79275.1 hypothetical protein [Pandoravirus aubagnensis]